MKSRRQFLATSTAGIWAASTFGGPISKPKLKKAVKFGMIGEGKTIADKFALIKELGFAGVEMDSPSDVDIDEAVKARDQVGITIHGVVNSKHWQIRMSDPKEEIRQQAVANMKTAINDCKKYGGATVLLVPGRVANSQTENYDQVWERSQQCVREVIPLAEKLEIKICIETVWNDFITTPKQMIDYVDSFKNPIVGTYFDISNMIKYGVPPASWIRQLGKRLYKFDFKGYSLEKAKREGNAGKGFCEIGEGSEDWPEVLKALEEVGYEGFTTAEVGGGKRDRLATISKQMDKVLGLDS